MTDARTHAHTVAPTSRETVSQRGRHRTRGDAGTTDTQAGTPMRTESPTLEYTKTRTRTNTMHRCQGHASRMRDLCTDTYVPFPPTPTGTR